MKEFIMPARIDIDREQIAAFCKRNQIRKLSLFGSVLTDRFGPDSDVWTFLWSLNQTPRLASLPLVG
jgi:predicted nucleotidyltransferase